MEVALVSKGRVPNIVGNISLNVMLKLGLDLFVYIIILQSDFPGVS